MMLRCIAAGDLVDTVRFTIRVDHAATRTDRAGPDEYGYYAYDNTDTAFALHPDFEYADISTDEGGGTNLHLNDLGPIYQTAGQWVSAQLLPFRFIYYGRAWDSITVCSNGWCAMGDQTSADYYVHMPIPGMLSPSAMIAPYFADLATFGVTAARRGVWFKSDDANHRCIIQWKAYVWNDVCGWENGDMHGFTSPLDFEVILYDEAFTPTHDNNGRIVVQYNVVSMDHEPPLCALPRGCTIGITSPDGMDGLPVVYDTLYSPGSAPIINGRAILFTTDTDIYSPASPQREVPAALALYPNYPNPFNPSTEIHYYLPRESKVELRIYDILGREAAVLDQGTRESGEHRLTWNASGMATGIYLCQLKADGKMLTQKMVLLR
jgi:hypothetical protein